MTTETKVVRFDWAIKNLLRNKANFDVLEGFLSAILHEEISVLEILESESNQSDAAKKFNRVDILVKDSQERRIIIEIQNHRETGYFEPVLWGVSKLIVDNLELGGDYRNITKVISISIIYFEFGLGNDDNYVYHGVTDVQGLQTPTSFRFRRKMGDNTFKTLCTKDIFPEYYLIYIEHFQDVIATDLDEWIYMLKHSAIRADFKAKNIERAGEKLTLLKMKPEERRRYERYLMDVAVERDVIKTALQEGENKAKFEMAHKLLAKGMDKDEIALLTGLSVDTITQDA